MPMLASTMMAGPRRMLTRPKELQQTLREPPPRAVAANGRSPEDIKREREEAQRMMAAGSDYSPIQHWSQGVARVVNAGLGAWQDARLRREETDQRKSATDRITALLAGINPQAGQMNPGDGDSKPEPRMPWRPNVTSSSGSDAAPTANALPSTSPVQATQGAQQTQPPPDRNRAIIEAMMDPAISQWATESQKAMLAPLYARAMETPDQQRARALQTQKLEREASGATDNMREYDWAVQNGFKGSPMDFMTTLKRSAVTPLAAQIPGTGFTVDAQGNIVPGGGGAQQPQPPQPMPAPTTQPPAAGPPMADGGGVSRFSPTSAERAQMPGASPSPTMQPAPAAAPMPQPQAPAQFTPTDGGGLVPLTGEALKRANLGSAPTGKQWGINPQTGQPGLMQIEGFQAEIPGEIAARFGLSADFFKDTDFIIDQIEKGVTSGLKGQANLAMARGEAGQVWRLASDGSDAMQRLLTGAGMPASEAANYVARFLPTFGDTKATQLDKVKNLTRRLKAIVETAGRGRIPPEEIKRILGVTEVGDQRPGDAPAGPPPEAVQMLGPNPTPQMRKYFDETFGPGASEQIVPPTGPAGGPLMDAPPIAPAPQNVDPYGLHDLTRQREQMQQRPHHKRMLIRQ